MENRIGEQSSNLGRLCSFCTNGLRKKEKQDSTLPCPIARELTKSLTNDILSKLTDELTFLSNSRIKSCNPHCQP